MSTSRLSEILNALMQSGSEPDHALADRYIKDNPDLAVEIAGFISAWDRDIAGINQEAVDQLTPDQLDINSVVNRAIARVNEARTLRQLVPPATKVHNPFLSLQGEQVSQLATQLRVRKVLLAKLRDRQIELNSIPDRFLKTLADMMGTELRALREHLQGEPHLFGGLEFKSRKKPRAGSKQTFESALRSPLDQRAIDYWLPSDASDDGFSNGEG